MPFGHWKVLDIVPVRLGAPLVLVASLVIITHQALRHAKEAGLGQE
nr:hypothetical protein [Pseudoxanthomonas sp.]